MYNLLEIFFIGVVIKSIKPTCKRATSVVCVCVCVSDCECASVVRSVSPYAKNTPNYTSLPKENVWLEAPQFGAKHTHIRTQTKTPANNM